MRILLLTLCTVFSTYSSASDGQSSVRILIENVRSTQGTLKLCVTDNPDKYLKNMESCKSVAIETTGQVAMNLHQLSPGTYAFVVFHDENNNGRLDQGLFKRPKEPYGFSNNPRALFGPPGFEKAKVDVRHPQQTIKIKL